MLDYLGFLSYNIINGLILVNYIKYIKTMGQLINGLLYNISVSFFGYGSRHPLLITPPEHLNDHETLIIEHRFH